MLYTEMKMIIIFDRKKKKKKWKIDAYATEKGINRQFPSI
jgi:hypothetical protein